MFGNELTPCIAAQLSQYRFGASLLQSYRYSRIKTRAVVGAGWNRPAMAVLFTSSNMSHRMSAAPLLFSPITIGSVELPNRIMVSPMCQYSAREGNPTDWHYVHLGNLALSGAGLLCLEATAVVPGGRITPFDLGLYNDDNNAALQGLVKTLRTVSPIKLGIQLSHAGRKASSRAPWDGGSLIGIAEGGWQTEGPSALAQRPDEPPPAEMTVADIDRVTAAFVGAARRAEHIGFDIIELHMAHGYLMHQFLSPLSNQRADEYGGSLENRMRMPLEVFQMVRDAVGDRVPVGVRLSASDWVEGGWEIEQSVALCKRLEALGCSYLDISSGGLSPEQKIPVGPGYQVAFAARIKQEVGIPVISVGLITEAAQAEAILQEGKADMIAMARAMLYNPRWPWHAAAELGGSVMAPPQYWRCAPHGSPQIFGNIRTGQR